MLPKIGVEGIDDGELDAELRTELGTELGDEGVGDRVGDRVSVHGGVTDENVVFGVYRGVFEIGVLFFFTTWFFDVYTV
jgi:hypothetical protein